MKAKESLVLFAILIATVSIAGERWAYECATTNCQFNGCVYIGGGTVYEQVSGYCTTCKKFVSVQWRRNGTSKASDLPDKPPAKLGTVWNPASGLTADLYPCPTCKKPFMEVNHIDFRLLPKRIMELWELADERHDQTHDKDAQTLSWACRDVREKGLYFCPACTNLTLRLRHGGWFD